MESTGLGLVEGPQSVNARDPSTPAVHPLPAWLLVAAIFVVGLLLGYLGLVLPAPGGSLIVPAGFVTTVAVAVAVVGGTYLFVHGARGQSGLFVGVVLLLAAIAWAWTFEFSLPAQMAWDARASSQAQEALRQVQQGPVDARGIPLHPCRILQAGSIGPLGAPYDECATSYVDGFGNRVNFVLFTPLGARTQGLAYTNIGSATFEDQCYRHLLGDWWAFSGGDLSNPMNPCPFGYEFHGGG